MNRTIGNNFKVQIIADQKDQFWSAFELAWNGQRTATHYKVTKNHLVFYWHECSGGKELPYEMDIESAREFALNWLYKQAIYPKEPDQDGSNYRGFEITTGDDWGHIDNNFYSILGIKPEWIMCGK